MTRLLALCLLLAACATPADPAKVKAAAATVAGMAVAASQAVVTEPGMDAATVAAARKVHDDAMIIQQAVTSGALTLTAGQTLQDDLAALQRMVDAAAMANPAKYRNMALGVDVAMAAMPGMMVLLGR